MNLSLLAISNYLKILSGDEAPLLRPSPLATVNYLQMLREGRSPVSPSLLATVKHLEMLSRGRAS